MASGLSAIVPAAGQGKRIGKIAGSNLTKPYLDLGGRPILARTLEQLEAVPEIREIVVACEPSAAVRVNKIAREFGLTKLRKVVPGGKTRTDSVWKALGAVSKKAPYVMVHDGVRPFLSAASIQKFIRAFLAGKGKALVAGRPVTPTLKEVSRGRVKRTLNREAIWEIETPQIFSKRELMGAYRAYRKNPFPVTDDASLIEHAGGSVTVLPCEEMNMKITTARDLQTARALWPGASSVRTGWGEDRHRLEKGRPLFLGGIRVPSPAGAVGHSDGDCLLHAVIDALLGAAGLGDIGDHFPDTGTRWRGARSEKMLVRVLSLVRARKFRLLNADCTVILEKPKLRDYKAKIRKKTARLLGLQEDAVGIKAKTGEGIGPEGRGELIIAHAVVTLCRES